MDSLVQQAEAAHRRGDLDAAKRLYTQQLSVDSQQVDALYGLGTVLMQAQQFSEAEPLLSMALALEPDAADIAYNYAICLRSKGDNSSAAELAARAGRSGGMDEPFSVNVCKLLLALNKPQLALEQLDRFPNRSQASHLLRAQAFGLLGAWDRSVGLLRQLWQADSTNAEVAQALALAAGRLRDYDLAIKTYGDYLRLITPGAAEFVKFADLFLLARKVDQCESYVQYAREAGAETTEFYLLQARLWRLKGDYAQAIAASEAALKKNSANAEAWSVLLEISQPDALPIFLQRIQASLQEGSWSAYEKQLIAYVQADAHARLGETQTAFRFYREANTQQKRSMEAASTHYDSSANNLACERILQQFAQYAAVPVKAGGRATPLFIVGMPRSGTTLVERILAQLPNVAAGGENEALGFLVTQYQNDVALGKAPLPEKMSGLDWRTLAMHYFEKTPLYLDDEGAGAEGNFITDKMPHNFQHVGMILSLFPDARVIQMRRDPRDICWSIFTRMFPEGHNYAVEFQSLADTYSISHKLMNHWAALAPDRVMNVSYEALVASPRVVGQQITDFCGLPWSDKCLDFYKKVSTSFTFSELQVREAINEQRIGRWQPFEEYLMPLIEELKRVDCLE